MKLEGGCYCGALRYVAEGEPVLKAQCHCRECQRQSASAFGISVSVPRLALRLTRGTPRFWSRATDTGRRLHCAFCPDCGSRVWHEGAADNPMREASSAFDRRASCCSSRRMAMS